MIKNEAIRAGWIFIEIIKRSCRRGRDHYRNKILK